MNIQCHKTLLHIVLREVPGLLLSSLYQIRSTLVLVVDNELDSDCSMSVCHS